MNLPPHHPLLRTSRSRDQRWRRLATPLVTGVVLAAAAWMRAADAPSIPAAYKQDFQASELRKVPEEFLVLDGGFAVAEEGGNRYLELPGSPLETFGVFFGPTVKENLGVRARILGTGKGRRFPTFAVGLNGQGAAAYKLQVTPAKKALELFRGEELKASAPFEWKSGVWTSLRLEVRAIGPGRWIMEGKAWTGDTPEPAPWMVTLPEDQQPLAGRASIWGSPYSGTPIRFDDLEVGPVP